jgi:hypothetical protein
MASQKFRPAALQRFFRTSTYLMYAFTPEKPLRLAGRNFCLAILFEGLRRHLTLMLSQESQRVNG